MGIQKICFENEGYVQCRSSFYTALDTFSKTSSCALFQEINKLEGEIDSGNWAISYFLSMYQHKPKDFILFEEPRVLVDDKETSVLQLNQVSCYMDRMHPLFSTKKSIQKIVVQGLKNNKLNFSCDEIKDLFQISDDRFERPLAGVGNEIFKAMAAIGFSYKKEIFCFPWLSNRRFESYHENLTTLLQILEKLGKTVIIPVGISPPKT